MKKLNVFFSLIIFLLVLKNMELSIYFSFKEYF
ncbi:Hypothetical Protein SLY_0314 [Strawberry lethal yellows phytoplasma (CPA) str. NZSb11]|uniref:Uncharacterized protein n=1 Tax=Strawberry lethal yellows phytoplasma (CPA) str. NZSb11 TaxID=980422 RepID=R4RP29_PHYAS|nr:Hypothetical Protein SLY_0314 [Strawberry lethal yellows phytoplasma (CPA) str. NZSb11]